MNQKEVHFIRCSSYDKAATAVPALLDNAGFRADSFRGRSVLIKPNMLSDREPERATTTHPEIVRPIIRLLKNAGAVPAVADSPASATKLEKVWDKTGFRTLCREEDVELINAEKAGSVRFKFEGTEYSIAKPFLEASALINVPKLKTHVLTSITAGVKNLYGTIPGFQKAQLHKRFPKVNSFCRLLADIHSNCTPEFNVLDAVIGMDGEGPGGGDNYSFGFIAASGSAVAMDFAVTKLLNISPLAVPYLPMLCAPLSAAEYMDSIIFCGDLKRTDVFKINKPSTLGARLIPAWLVKIIDPLIWIRPAFRENCIKCGKCIEACPAKALAFNENRKVTLSPELCIGCCCCHEVCPVSAVQMTQSPLLNFIRKGRMP